MAEDGTVFALDQDLYAYDRDGRLSFRRDLGPAYFYGTKVGVIDGDVVYAGLLNTLHAFNVSGTKIGEYTIPDLFDDFYFMTPAIGPDREIILPMRKGDESIGAPGAIASMWWVDGSLNWMFELGGLNLLYPPAVNRDGLIVVSVADLNDPFAAELQTSLLCFEPNGDLHWRNDNMALGVPLVDDVNGRVLIRASLDNREPSIVAFDLERGELAWEFAPGGDYSYDEDVNFGRGMPLALDTANGVCYAFWESYTWDSTESQLLTAIGPGGQLLWSSEWADNEERDYFLSRHPIIDADGFVYVFYSWGEYDEQGVEQRVVCCCEVFDPEGQMIAQNEYPSDSGGFSWLGCEPAIGPDRRIYMFAQDFDYPVTCSLYAFGTDSEPPPEYRPTILSAGYGLSHLTHADGGLLTINANVHHPLGTSKIASVEVLINGQPTGFSLLHGESPGQYSLSVDIAPGMLSLGQFLLELVATDTDGKASDLWPYLTVASSGPDQ